MLQLRLGKKRCNPRYAKDRHTFCTEEFAGDVEGLAADYYDPLAIEQLLSDNAGQATQEMSFAIDHDLYQ